MDKIMYEKLKLYDELMAHCVVGANITIKDDIMCDKNGEEMAWTDYEYLLFPKSLPNTDINGVLIFGDGTIEFHDVYGNAYNWAEYSIEVIKAVNDYIKTNIISKL